MVLYGFYSHLSCEVEDLSSRPCVCKDSILHHGGVHHKIFITRLKQVTNLEISLCGRLAGGMWADFWWGGKPQTSLAALSRPTTTILRVLHRERSKHMLFFLPSFQEIDNRSATWLINLWFVPTLPSPQIHSHILRSVKIKYKNKSQEILIPSIDWWLCSRSAYPKKTYSKLYHPNK